MNRKDFLRTSVFSAFALSTFGFIVKKEENFSGDCETTNDILGPFYRDNAPVRNNLINKDMEGQEVLIKGIVYGSDCSTLLKDAKVEIWHCSNKCEYDNTSDKYQHRAQWYTDENGFYSFKTLLPGKYLNGNQFRPAHIHFRVSAKNQDELISQLYFKGDPHITSDPWAKKKSAENRILPIVLEDSMGNLVVNFNIYLS